ncbi:MAG: type III secretion system export apparatus subunit SctR [Myxococcota bacterium]
MRLLARMFVGLCLAYPTSAVAQPAAEASLAERPLLALLLLAGLSLLPFAFVTATSFVKISVVLSILRNALGTGQVPSGTVITGLSLILTLYVMTPVGEAVAEAAGPGLASVDPAGQAGPDEIAALREAVTAGKEPLREFLARHAGEREQSLFLDLARRSRDAGDRDAVAVDDFLVVLPAFLISELKEAFQIGFLVFLPFLVIDMVVANVLLALGMHMLSPTTVSLPFKLLLFVLVDGWYLLARGLVLGYAG